MPLYEFHCESCDTRFESQVLIAKRDDIMCACGAKPKRLISRTKEDWFKPFVSEDFTGEPIEVKSKEHYKSLCKEHQVYAPHAFGQGFNISEI